MDIFSLDGKVAVVLGGAGVLGEAMVRGLAEAGASVVIASRTEGKAAEFGKKLAGQGLKTCGFQVDATSEAALAEFSDKIDSEIGAVDILVNAVGGNRADATANDTTSFFDINPEALRAVVDLNLFGGVISPCQIFGRKMAENPNGGSIINISSMAAVRPLTRVIGYSAAKASVNNFTQWLSVYLATNSKGNLRVNAVAPGFFLTEQNRFLLTDKDTGELTPRGRSILDHTPMGRFGDPDDLVGAMVWLASDAAKFVTGIVVPVDGGFSAFGGV